jgi:hypothetical protein
VRTEFVSNLGIPYENGGPISLCVNNVVVSTIDGIRLLLEVEVVETIVVLTYEGEIGGGRPPVVAV